MADENKDENKDEQKEEVKEEEKKEESKQEEKPSSSAPAEATADKEEKQEEKKEEPKKEEPKKEEPKEEEEEVEVPEKFKKLVEEIEKMAVLDLAELVKILEKKFGVSASAAMVAAPAGGGGGEEGGDAGAEEKTIFNVELKEIGDKKIEVIKAVRDITAQGLKEAKDMVDAAPKVIKEGVKKEEAEEIKKKLETAGATVELK